MGDQKELAVETNPDPLITALVKINVTEKILADLRKKAQELPTPKAGDKEGYEAVRRHRLDMVPLRTTTVKVLKAMREEALAFQKKVVAKENEITGNIAESEAICQAKEDSYLAELQAIEDEKNRKEQARVQILLDKLALVDWVGDPSEVAKDTPEQFEARFTKAKADYEEALRQREAEATRIRLEDEARKAQEEANRIESERLAKEQKKLADDRAALEAEKKRIADEAERAEKARLQRDADEQRQKADRERQEREKAEAEALKLRQAEEARRAEELHKEEEAAAELKRLALAPDVEKAKRWVTDLLVPLRNLPTIKGAEIDGMVQAASAQIEGILDRLVSDLDK